MNAITLHNCLNLDRIKLNQIRQVYTPKGLREQRAKKRITAETKQKTLEQFGVRHTEKSLGILNLSKTKASEDVTASGEMVMSKGYTFANTNNITGIKPIDDIKIDSRNPVNKNDKGGDEKRRDLKPNEFSVTASSYDPVSYSFLTTIQNLTDRTSTLSNRVHKSYVKMVRNNILLSRWLQNYETTANESILSSTVTESLSPTLASMIINYKHNISSNSSNLKIDGNDMQSVKTPSSCSRVGASQSTITIDIGHSKHERNLDVPLAAEYRSPKYDGEQEITTTNSNLREQSPRDVPSFLTKQRLSKFDRFKSINSRIYTLKQSNIMANNTRTRNSHAKPDINHGSKHKVPSSNSPIPVVEATAQFNDEKTSKSPNICNSKTNSVEVALANAYNVLLWHSPRLSKKKKYRTIKVKPSAL